MANVELASKVLDLITKHPELHDQSTWVSTGRTANPKDDFKECGTTACVAGWATILHHNLTPTKNTYGPTDYCDAYYSYAYRPPKGMDWDTAGMNALDIGSTLATNLFFNTTREEAIGALEDLVAEVGEDWVTERIRMGYYLPE